MAQEKHPPAVIWAQRNDKIYLTINVEDCTNAKISFDENKLHFSGNGSADKIDYELTVEFYKEINPEKSHYVVLPRHIPMIVVKKEEGPYWPRLLKNATKVHWLKTDFNKWRDEDDSDVDESKDADFDEMMKKMGTFDAKGGDDLMNEKDSDDEELPDLE